MWKPPVPAMLAKHGATDLRYREGCITYRELQALTFPEFRVLCKDLTFRQMQSMIKKATAPPKRKKP